MTFVANHKGDFDLFRVKVDGTGEAPLTTSSARDNGPDYNRRRIKLTTDCLRCINAYISPLAGPERAPLLHWEKSSLNCARLLPQHSGSGSVEPTLEKQYGRNRLLD